MTERPIIMQGESVRAFLAGRKTQTRRPTRVDTGQVPGGEWRCCPAVDGSPGREWVYTRHGVVRARATCPYGAPGDRLWVRETWGRVGSWHCPGRPQTEDPHDGDWSVIYRADGPPEGLHADSLPSWRPSIYMPRWASRLTLEVTGVRVERVREITEADAVAEGCPDEWLSDYPNPLGWYARAWDALHGKKPGEAWADDPWVWCVDFRRVTP